MPRFNKAPQSRFRKIAVHADDRTYLKSITLREAVERIADGSAVPMTPDCSGEIPGWESRKIYKFTAIMVKSPLFAKESPASISRSTMEAFAYASAGLLRSKTAGLSDEKRRNRVANGLPEEDYIELAVAKVRLWPEIGDHKAIRVRPRVEPRNIHKLRPKSINGARSEQRLS